MGMEIERKWLVKTIPDSISEDMKAGRIRHSDIIQGYLCTDPVVRVRKNGEKYTLSYKGSGKVSREEYELPLNQDAFQKLISKCEGFILEKKRFYIPVPENSALTIELDLFGGSYDGLIYAEVEFSDEDSAMAFLPPEWFDRELTQEKGWSNAALSLAKPSGLC